MERFSERYGFIKNVIVKDNLPLALQNNIYNLILTLLENESVNHFELDYDFWVNFLFEKKHLLPESFYCKDAQILNFIDSPNNPWYRKIDAIEFLVEHLSHRHNTQRIQVLHDRLNAVLSRHNFAYRIINGSFIEVTSEEECRTIAEASSNSLDGVKKHLATALEKLSASQPHPDYRNSIKESISAVECLCREITGESTLDKALKKLDAKGVVINAQMKKGLENLYYYTNDGSTGIRHALMEDVNAPTVDEAIFMLVSCSTFVNYITKKISNNGQ